MTAHRMSAAAQAHRGLMRFAFAFLRQSRRDLRAGLFSLAQTEAELASEFIELTRLLWCVLYSAAPPQEAWDRWVSALEQLAPLQGLTRLLTPNDTVSRASAFLERLLLVQWGHYETMLAHGLPDLASKRGAA